MKKSLLFITVLLAMVGTGSAQDIWSTVKRWNRNHMEAALYKNAQQKLFFSPGYEPVEALVLNGHTYFAYVNNSQGSFIADYTTSNTTTYLETGAGSWIEDIFPGGNGTGVYAVGEKNVGEFLQAAVWKDGTLQLLGDGTLSSRGYCGCVGEDDKIYVGGLMSDEDASFAVIWYDGELLYSFPDSWIEDIAFYDGNVYSALWHNSNYYVYKNDEMIYDLNIGYNDEVRGMFIEGGDIYLIGEKDFYEVVWKNGEIFIGGYNTPFYNYDIDNIWVNSDGVYLEYGGSFGSSSTVLVWKNNETFLHITNTNGLGENISIGKWFVEPLECENTFSRNLPYFEGFEMGETDWECWTKIDVDGDNGGSASYWDRGGKSEGLNTKFPHTGDHVAIHRNAASGRPQEGWLISPDLDLRWSYETTLSFYSYNENSSSYNSGYEGVWISTDSDPYNLSSYTELWHPSSVTSSWEQVTIDLSDYAGQDVVYIAFKYMGNEAHEWLIDDISFTESVWSPCEPITDFPFEEHFDTDPFVNGSCWYRLDIDINNGEYGSYWNWYSDNECVWHQFGPSGVEQEGWLFSPSLQLESGRDYTLSFNSSFSYPDDYGKSSVWIALDYGGEPYPFYYTKIWEETHPTEEWVQHTIDLSAYAGSTVNIAFKYEGTYAHAWYVDDIVISEGLPQYTVAVESSNTAWGTVSGGGTFDEGTDITIHATPQSGHVFLKWIKDGAEVSANADYSFRVDSSTSGSYTAWFGEPSVTYYTITAIPNDPSLGSVRGGGTFASGSETTLWAVATGSNVFSGWNDGNTENPRTVTVTGDATYIAVFEAPVYYTLAVSSQNSEMGTVTGGGKYLEGTEVTVTAVPNSGYVFDHWNDGNTDNPRKVVMNSDITLKAFFKSTGVDENDVTALSLYPNPAKETLRIKGLEANSELLFYNTLGMMVKRVTARADEEISVSDLAPGLYLIRCNGQTIRFVKK